jgi:endonuclease G, mitochondrial
MVVEGTFEPAVVRAYRWALRFLRRPYVTGVAVGEPEQDGSCQVEEPPAVCIYVQEKMPLSLLRRDQVLPREIDGIRLDVIERTFRSRALSDVELLRRQLLPADPAQPGVQVGIAGRGAGSFGMVVYDRVSGSRCLLSAAHVLDGPADTLVFQPGTRNEALPIGSIVRSLLDHHGDAAIARLDRMRSIDGLPLGANLPLRGPREVRPKEILAKSGAETGVTRGVVSKMGQLSVTYPLPFHPTEIVMEAFELRPVDPQDSREISDQGDSGSAVYDETTGEAVGLIVGGDAQGPANPDEYLLACHLLTVFDKLKISLDPNDRIHP